ncbi:maleylpyruvate isomerase family mycothiol-dependent enzyme [Jatrophihabitans endophyticus]|nr:maleylpyruvate isomerase family mycothiol-dependent enzyme [Jatrophihabitans endophyticus]
MPDPTAALQAVRTSTADLLKGLEEHRWSDDELRAPSRCAGWTRGHVLTHLARNADGIAATLAGALRGEVVPRYPGGGRGRDQEIEDGAPRPALALLADVSESAERLDRVFGAVQEAGRWDARTDGGLTAADWPARRLREVEIHRVDLAGDYGPDRWPPLLVAELLPGVMTSLAERVATGVHVVVDAAGSVAPEPAGQEWTVGDGAVEVRGPDWAVLAWATGRGAAATGLGEAPGLAPWR